MPGSRFCCSCTGSPTPVECFPDLVARLGSSYRIVAPDALGARRLRPVHARGAGVRRTRSRRCTPRRRGGARGHRSGAGARPLDGWRHGRGAGRAPAATWSRAVVVEDPAWMDESPWGDEEDGETVSASTGPGPSAADPAGAIAQCRAENPTLAGERVRPRGRRAKADVDETFLRAGIGMLGTPWREIAAAIEPPALVVTGDQEVILHAELLAEVRPPEPAVRRARSSKAQPTAYAATAAMPSTRSSTRGCRGAAATQRGPEAGQPPATAGMMLIWVPSGVVLSRPSRNRTSSLPT